MIPVQQIISQAINYFNDIELDYLEQAEIVDMTNDIGMDIAEVTDYYIYRYQDVPKSSPTDPDTNEAVVPYTDASANSDLSPYGILQAIRGDSTQGYTPCREYSYQAVRSEYTDNYPYYNRGRLGKYDYHASHNITTGELNLYFGEDFQLNESVIVTLSSNRMFGDPIFGSSQNTLTRLGQAINNSLAIPDFMRNAFRWGLIRRISEKEYFRGNDAYTWRQKEAKSNYQSELLNVEAYVKRYKDRSSTVKLQPLNYWDADK